MASFELALEQIPDSFSPHPQQSAEEREALSLLAKAIKEELTERQRKVFVAIALNDPSLVFPGTAIHLRSCPGCQAGHEGLLSAVTRFREEDHPPETRS